MSAKRIFEINARVWLKRFNNGEYGKTLKDAPREYWSELKGLGIDYIYLMGMWDIPRRAIKKYCFEEDLVKEYRSALKDFNDEDVEGSPFAIEDYIVNPKLGSEEELKALRDELHSMGFKLILDFIPNHFSAETSILDDMPDIFLQGSEQYYRDDPHTFFKYNGSYFAHGRDPFFPAWQDTVQVNYFSKKAREFMLDKLRYLTTMCDGVRCDMAMLNLNNIFANTWGSVISGQGLKKPESEFWKYAIDTIKAEKKDFIFLAESYWDLEWELQQHGFDYTYDKKLTDRLQTGFVNDIRDHLRAEHDYQVRSARFIENHDEERSVKLFGKNRSKAAAVIISTLQGLQFFHDGQFDGKRIKLPVQLGREPAEQKSKCLREFYMKLLEITSQPVFREGKWELIDTMQAWEGNPTNDNILVWRLTLDGERRLVAINYSDVVSQLKVKLDTGFNHEKIKFHDLLTGQNYSYYRDEIEKNGLYIELGGYRAHIFNY